MIGESVFWRVSRRGEGFPGTRASDCRDLASGLDKDLTVAHGFGTNNYFIYLFIIKWNIRCINQV